MGMLVADRYIERVMGIVMEQRDGFRDVLLHVYYYSNAILLLSFRVSSRDRIPMDANGWRGSARSRVM